MAGLRMPLPSELGGHAMSSDTQPQREAQRSARAALPEGAAPPRPPSPKPGDVLHELVVGVDPSCEWRPFQAPPPPPTDIEETEGDDKSLLLLERTWRHEEKISAEAGYRYALALMQQQ